MSYPEEDLWDPLDHAGLRRRIEEGVVEEAQAMFPASYGGVRLEANNWRLKGKERYSTADQKKAWMERKHLSRPLKADFKLIDESTGKTLDEKHDVTLMRIPYYTDRGTFVYNGNNFTASHQARLMPGAYARRQNNGALEVQMNTRTGTGKVMRIGLDAETGQFRLKTAGSNLHLYSLLKDLGVPEEEIEEAWGSEVAEINRNKYDSRTTGRAFNKLVPVYARDKGTPQDLLRDALEKAQVSEKAVSRTLAAYWKVRDKIKQGSDDEVLWLVRKLIDPTPKVKVANFDAGFDIRDLLGEEDAEGDRYRPIGTDGLLAATRKLLAINRGQDETDDRNIPAFTKIYPMDKLMRERIRFDEGRLRRNLLRMIASRKTLDPLHHRVFDNYLQEIITKNPLTTPIEETNPLQLVGQQRRVTQMGPGGIGSSDAITEDMQAVQASEFGFYSPVEGPECFDDETLVLTKEGWIPWREVTSEERFACLRKGKIFWDYADRIIRKPYVGPMIQITNAMLRVGVTPSHRIYWKNHWASKAEDVNYAVDLIGRNLFLPTPSGKKNLMSWTAILEDDWSIKQDYDGIVYCAQVPGKRLLCRGSMETVPYWSGNSERAGVDVRLAYGVKIGKDGRMRRSLINRHTGQREYASPEDLYGKFLKLPD